MKRFRAFLLAIVLIFCTACSAVQNSPADASHGESGKNTEPATKSTESEEINEAEIAQQAYDLIENAESLCKSGMSIISAAWYFGIWVAPECGADTVMDRLSAQIGFEVSFIEGNGGYTAAELINGDGELDGWEFCLMTAENCLSATGTYISVGKALETARDLIRELPDNYTSYQYLKDYYTKVAVYAAYFENVSGSYNDMTETITECESNIQAAKEPLLFDFG